MATREEKLAEIIGEIQDLRNDGKTPDREAYLARYPDFTEDLESYLDCESFLEGALIPTASPLEPPPAEEIDRLDLRAFPIRRRLEDVSLGTVYLLSGVDREVQRELVVMRGWFTPAERDVIERSAKYAAGREGRGVLPILDVARLNQVPFVIRAHNRGPTLQALLRALSRGGGEETLAGVRADWASRLGDGEDDEVLDPAAAPDLARSTEHVGAILKLFARWGRILGAAHRRGVWHLDITPSTLQIDHRDEPVIQGVGLSWAGTGIGPERMRGWDPQWTAPEICDASWGATSWLADVWGFGMSLCAALSLAEPFGRQDPGATVLAISGGAAAFAGLLPPQIPEPLADIVRRCTAYDLAARPSDLAVVADELDALADRPHHRRFSWLRRRR